jgi:hypothetical protein
VERHMPISQRIIYAKTAAKMLCIAQIISGAKKIMKTISNTDTVTEKENKMNWDYLYLGPVPCDESCAQLGEPDYRKKAIAEMNAYVDMLYRLFPETEEKNVLFKTKWENHDFGTYGEVVVAYVVEEEQSREYAFHIESNLPMNWDNKAMAKIRGLSNA